MRSPAETASAPARSPAAGKVSLDPRAPTRFPADLAPPVPGNPAAPSAAYDHLMAILRARRSCRRYDPARPVPTPLLDLCVEAARLAPSACNRQPWRFVLATDPAVVAQLRAGARRAGVPHPWWDHVPAFVALCAKLDLLTHTVAPIFSGIPYYLLDLGIAGEHFVLAAETLGLGTCWIGWFDERAARRILQLPRSWRLVSLLTVGWPEAAAADTPRASRLELAAIRHWNRGE